MVRGPTTPLRETGNTLSTDASEYRVVAEVARVAGGEKIDVVSDSGEEDIRVGVDGCRTLPILQNTNPENLTGRQIFAKTAWTKYRYSGSENNVVVKRGFDMAKPRAEGQ